MSIHLWYSFIFDCVFLSAAKDLGITWVVVPFPSFVNLLPSMETTQSRIKFIIKYFLGLTYYHGKISPPLNQGGKSLKVPLRSKPGIINKHKFWVAMGTGAWGDLSPQTYVILTNICKKNYLPCSREVGPFRPKPDNRINKNRGTEFY